MKADYKQLLGKELTPRKVISMPDEPREIQSIPESDFAFRGQLMLDIKEAAQMLFISVSSMRRLVESGKLKNVRMTCIGKRKFYREDLINWYNAHLEMRV